MRHCKTTQIRNPTGSGWIHKEHCYRQGRIQVILYGGVVKKRGWDSMVGVSTPRLGGSGGMPPQEILRFEVL